jgi:chromosome segregation ATPase
MFERCALPPVVAAAVGEVASAVCIVQASEVSATLTSAHLCAVAAAATLSRSRWGGQLSATGGGRGDPAPIADLDGTLAADGGASSGGSPHPSGSGVNTLTQKAGSVWGGTVSGSGSGNGVSRKQRAAIIEQLTSERDQLRDELQSAVEEARVAEARAARAASERNSLTDTTEQLYARVIALANALAAARDQCAEARAASSGTFAMLSREREAHDAAVAKQAVIQDDLSAARDSIHALEARLLAERQDSELRAEHADGDINAMARRIEELEEQAEARERHVAGLEEKLTALTRLSEAIGGLAGQMGASATKRGP